MAPPVLRRLEALQFSLAAKPQSFYHAAPIFFGSLLHDLAEAI
jgi:hypothetical protein